MEGALIFAVFGASGVGKSTILQLVEEMSPRITIHQKDTTRPPRKNEPESGTRELCFVEQLHPLEQYEVHYSLYGYSYGVRGDQLRKAIANREIHFIIINDITALQRFKSKHPEVVTLYIHTDKSNIPEHYKARDPLEYEERKKRIRQQYMDFIYHNTLFDHVVLNFWHLENAKEQIRNIIELHAQKSLAAL